MKKFIGLSLGFVLILMFACQQQNAKSEDQIGLMPAMEKFHTVLRPLQHQAVPNNDVEAIKSEAQNLYELAEQVADATLPEALQNQSETVKEHQQNLVNAVKNLQEQIQTGSSDDIISAFSDVHNQYENFADAIYSIDSQDKD